MQNFLTECPKSLQIYNFFQKNFTQKAPLDAYNTIVTILTKKLCNSPETFSFTQAIFIYSHKFFENIFPKVLLWTHRKPTRKLCLSILTPGQCPNFLLNVPIYIWFRRVQFGQSCYKFILRNCFQFSLKVRKNLSSFAKKTPCPCARDFFLQTFPMN